MGSSSGGQLLIALGSLLDDQQWHSMKLERLSAHLNLTVDRNTHQVQVPAELSDWDIHQVSRTEQNTKTWCLYGKTVLPVAEEVRVSR